MEPNSSTLREEEGLIMQKRVGNVRWGIAILLAVSIIINYFDRVNLSVGAKDIIKEFHLSQTEYGVILS